MADLIGRHNGIGMTSQRTRARMVERLREQGIRDEAVLTAMNSVPRHIFVDEALASRAYDDVSLPLGFGQTISNPKTVARMVELLNSSGSLKRVLEIGTGCGYQAAVLSKVSREVYTIERLAPLLAKARTALRELNIHNVKLRHGDGYLGYREGAPFDGIVLAAAATQVPKALLGQLAVGGKMVLPLGGRDQHLCVIERNEQGYIETIMDAVKFVPLVPGIN